MTQDQFIQSEVFKIVRSLLPEKTMLEQIEIFNHQLNYVLNDRNQLLIQGAGINHVFRWSDEKGIVGLWNESEDEVCLPIMGAY